MTIFLSQIFETKKPKNLYSKEFRSVHGILNECRYWVNGKQMFIRFQEGMQVRNQKRVVIIFWLI